MNNSIAAIQTQLQYMTSRDKAIFLSKLDDEIKDQLRCFKCNMLIIDENRDHVLDLHIRR